MLKNLSYEHEKEVRALLIAQLGRAEVTADGCDLPIKLPDFIDEIVVNPFSQKRFFTAVLGVVDRHGLRDKVKPSALSPDVFYMSVNSKPRGRLSRDAQE